MNASHTDGRHHAHSLSITVPSVTADQVGAALRVAFGAGLVGLSASALANGYGGVHLLALFATLGSGSMIATKTLLPLAFLLLMLVGMHVMFFGVVAP